MRTAHALIWAAAIASFGLAAHARAVDTAIPLNFNFNGLVHTGEQGAADAPSGYRSISDRGLLVQGAAGQLGTAPITGATGLPYTIVTAPGALDVVMHGSRGPGTGWPYDLTVDGDKIGIQPTWDPVPNHKTPQVTDVSALGLQMFANTEIGFLYQGTNGGGSFQVVLGFSDASSATVTLACPDWFNTPVVAAGGAGVSSQSRLGGTTNRWPATENNDSATTAAIPTASLSVFEGVISVSEMIVDGLGNQAGKTLTSITIQNGNFTGDLSRAYGVLAATVRGSAVFGPSGIGAAVPNPVIYNNTAKFTVTTTPGTGVPNAITGVTVNAASINAGSLVLNDSGVNGDVTLNDGVWSVDFVVPNTAPAGAASVSFDVVDAQARHGAGNILFSVVAPPSAIDLGTLPDGLTSFGDSMEPGQIKWMKFVLPADASAGTLTFLDVDTEGSSITGSTLVNDTYIGLYDAAGNRVAFDDDDGTDGESQLSFGVAAPARPAPGNGLTYNGRDGATLVAGTYYVFYAAFPCTTAATNWGVSTTHTGTGGILMRLNRGSAPTGGPPSIFTDLGSLVPGTPSTESGTLNPGEVAWFKFTLDSEINSANPTRTFLDIDTEGSSIPNTMIALFRDDGSGTLVLTDNDDGSDLWSQISYGRGTRLAPGNGLAYNGRDGATLAAGTYYLAVTEFNASFASNFIVAYGSGQSTADFTVRLHTGFQSPIIAGPIHNPDNGSDYYLVESGLNFTDAEAFAVTLGGHLASIADTAENEFVRTSVLMFDSVNRRGFIGLTDAVVEGQFEWTDGTPANFFNWNAGEPNNAGGTENYVEMFGSNGLWNDINLAGAVAGDFSVAEVPGSSACNPADITQVGGTAEDPGQPDNQLTVDDVILFINIFSDGTGCPGAAPCSRADVCGVGGLPNPPEGELTVDDIIEFFNAFSNGC